MDTKEDHAILVHYITDRDYCFNKFGKDLYYLNVSNTETIPLMTESDNTDYSFLSSMNMNMEYFHRAVIEGSNRARYLQHLLRWPSNQQLINALSKNLIINCPVL